MTNKIFVLALGAILLAFTQIQQLSDGRKGLEKNRNNRTVLFGYGGFDISETPTFTPAIAVWLEMGGIYALANIRGGGEYGEEWHLAGTSCANKTCSTISSRRASGWNENPVLSRWAETPSNRRIVDLTRA